MDPSRMQDQLMRNPEMMQQIMSSPMMDNLLSNPDMLRNIMQSNPQMQALMDSNPQIQQLMNDPAILRQSMEMMRNPNAMREVCNYYMTCNRRKTKKKKGGNFPGLLTYYLRCIYYI